MLRKSYTWIVGVGLALPACFALGQGSTPPATPRPATRPASKGVDPRTLQFLVQQGRTAVALEAFKAARDALTDVLQLDPKNSTALADLGYAYLRLEDFPKANKTLDAAVQLGQPSRATVLNASAVYIKTKNAMRAAKFIREYITAHPNDPADQALVDALGTALSQADDQAKRNRFFQECAQFYEQANAKLEATKPGQKRWGAQWMNAADADKKNAKFKADQAELAKYGGQMSAARAKFNSASEAKEQELNNARHRRNYVAHTAGFDSQMASANNEYEEAKKKYDAFAAKIERPPFEATIAAVSPEDPTTVVATAAAPPVPTAVATAGGSNPARPAQPVTPTAPPVHPGTPASVPPASPPAVAVRPPPAALPAIPHTVTMRAAGFPVAPDLIVTKADILDQARDVKVQLPDGDPMPAEVVTKDADTGLALLRVKQKMAYLPLADAFSGGPFQCVSYPTVSIFDPAPEVIPGSAVPPKAKEWAVRVNRNPRLGGGPILVNNKVVGVLLAEHDSDSSQVPAATLDDLKKLLSGQPAAAGARAADPTAVTAQVTAERGKA